MEWSALLIDRWGKLKLLSPAERRMLVQSVLLLPIIQLGLRIWGLRRVQATLLQLSRCQKRMNPRHNENSGWVHSIVKLVRIAERHGILRATCLAKSLCTWFLLRQHGIESDLRIGINRLNGTFEAHAWVERAGQVLNDRPDIQDFFFPFDTSIHYSAAGLE